MAEGDLFPSSLDETLIKNEKQIITENKRKGKFFGSDEQSFPFSI